MNRSYTVNFIFGSTLLNVMLFIFFVILYLSIDFGSYFDLELFGLAISFFVILINSIFVLRRNELFVFFSMLYFGYVFSGVYFSYLNNIEFARFYNLSRYQFDVNDLKFSLVLVIASYVIAFFAFICADKIRVCKINVISNEVYSRSGISSIAYLMYLIGVIYWLYYSFSVANGPIDIFLKIGIINEISNGLSTAPFFFTVAGSFLIFLNYLSSGKVISKHLMLMIFFSFLMMLSKGRLTASIVYLLSFPLMFYFYRNSNFEINIKYVKMIFILMVFLISLYFFRYFSSAQYSNTKIDEFILVMIGERLFGRANIGDLQSISFAIKYTELHQLLLGDTLLDTFRMILKLFGILDESISTGHRIKFSFFNEISGSPAPGIVSEMIMNFGVLGFGFANFFFIFFVVLIDKVFNIKGSVFSTFLHVQIILFLLVLVKVDSTNLMSLIWNVSLMLFVTFLLRVFFVKKSIV